MSDEVDQIGTRVIHKLEEWLDLSLGAAERQFVRDGVQAAHAAGAAEERARIVAVIEAEQLEWRAGTSHDDLLERLLKAVRQ